MIYMAYGYFYIFDRNTKIQFRRFYIQLLRAVALGKKWEGRNGIDENNLELSRYFIKKGNNEVKI